MTFLNGRLFLVLSAALSAAACGEVDSTVRSGLESEVRTGEGRHAVLYRFEGRFNTADLTMDLQLLPAETVDSLVPKASYCEVLVVQDGVPGSGPTDSLELFTPPGTIFRDEDCFGGAYPNPSPIINSYYQSARAFCGGVAIRSFFDTETLNSVYAVIDEVVPASGHFGYQFPLGTGAEAPTDGDQAPSAARGLWAYGDIAPGGESVQNWIFERRTEVEEITLNGTIVAYYDEICGDGIDNDCDGEADEGCVLGEFGDPCTLNTECSSGVCTSNACDLPRCSNLSLDGTETDIDCGGGACDACADGLDCQVGSDCTSGICAGGVCVPDEVPGAGDVVISEVFEQPGAPFGFIELYNASAGDRFLGGCTLENQLGQNMVLPSFSIGAGGYAVLVNDGAAAAGVPNVAFDWSAQTTFDAGRTNARYELVCASGSVAVLEFNSTQVQGLYDSYPGMAAVPEAGSLQIDVSSLGLSNWAAATNLCLSPDSTTVAGDYRYTPGAANASCDTATAPWCRLQWPTESLQIPAGASVDYYGRVYVEGLTDQGPTNEYYPRLRGQVGYGDDATDPSADGSWVWTDAEPYALWTPFASVGEAYENEVNNNEFVGTFTAPNSPGTTFDVAYRFSGDGGQTWTYCDRNVGAGSDGAEDGYQAANAGGFTVLTPTPVPAAPGDMIFTEFMPQPSGGDVSGEWFELLNNTATELQLQGCTIEQNGGGSFTVDTSLIAEPSGYVVFARSREPAENGGIPNVDYVYDAFALRSAAEQLVLSCPSGAGPVTIDVAGYAGNVAEGVSLQLKNSRLDGDSNDAGADYCQTFNAVYGDAGRRGTPGAANPDCVPLSFCRLQFPGSHTGQVGSTLTVFARVYGAGLTDLTGSNDANSSLVAQVGYGADGSQPDEMWTWASMSANGSYGSGSPGYEANNDEYQGDLTLPATDGSYDYAVRFSADGGVSWSLYCDTGNGSSDGYDPATAGDLTVQAARTIDYCQDQTTSSPPINHYTGEWIPAVTLVGVDGFTTDAGNFPATGIIEVQFGTGPADADPAVDDSAWTWNAPDGGTAALKFGPYFLYNGSYTVPSIAGLAQRSTSRARIDGGPWFYCDTNAYEPATSKPYTFADTVSYSPTAVPADWFNVQYPNFNRTINNGASETYYLQIYIAERNDLFRVMSGTTGIGVPFTNPEVEFGLAYGPLGSNPADGGWTRVPGQPNAGWNFGGNNDEYAVTVSPPPGSYSLAAYFTGSGGDSYQYRFNNAGSTNPGDAYQLFVNP